MEKYQVRDIALAPSGHRKIQWVRDNMPLLRGLEEEYTKTRPFEGIKISLSVHLEAKTAYLCMVLAAGGADMSVTCLLYTSQARYGQKDPRKPAGDRPVIMAYLRSKSSAKRAKAGVGSKTRSAGRQDSAKKNSL